MSLVGMGGVLMDGMGTLCIQMAGCVRPEPGENKQAQTQAVLRSYSHQCGGNMQVLRRVQSDGWH